MPRVGDKKFSYTDDGMRQASMHANRTGQNIVYEENDKMYGYQQGGTVGRNLGDRANQALSSRIYDEIEEDGLKRQFIEQHGRLPSDQKEPTSLLDESIKWKMLKQLAGPPQWIKNFQEADQMMEEGYDRYGRAKDHWPAFVKGVKSEFGYQEGGYQRKLPPMTDEELAAWDPSHPNYDWSTHKGKYTDELNEWYKANTDKEKHGSTWFEGSHKGNKPFHIIAKEMHDAVINKRVRDAQKRRSEALKLPEARKGIEETYGEGTGLVEGMARGMWDEMKSGFPATREYWGFQEGGYVEDARRPKRKGFGF